MEGTLQDFIILFAYYIAIGFCMFVFLELNVEKWAREKSNTGAWIIIGFWPFISLCVLIDVVVSAPQYILDRLAAINDRLKQKGQSHD